jgi:hypothetical protein
MQLHLDAIVTKVTPGAHAILTLEQDDAGQIILSYPIKSMCCDQNDFWLHRVSNVVANAGGGFLRFTATISFAAA